MNDFGVKVKGAIFMTRYSLPYLKKSDCGAICNITTAAGKASPGGAQPTSLSRAAGISLTKAWSKEFGEFGIRVNTVASGRSRADRTADTGRWPAPRTRRTRWKTTGRRTDPASRLDESANRKKQAM